MTLSADGLAAVVVVVVVVAVAVAAAVVTPKGAHWR